MSSPVRLFLAALAILAAFTTDAQSAWSQRSDAAARTLLRNTISAWDPGDRVRVTSPEPYRIQTPGWFEDAEGDSAIRLLTDRSFPPVTIRLGQIGTIEEKSGTKRHWRTGAAVGLIVGLLVGIAIEAVDRKEEPDEVLQGFSEAVDDSYIAIGAASGFVAGAAIGYLIKTDRWTLTASFE